MGVDPNFTNEAENLVRRYINTSHTGSPDEELSYDYKVEAIGYTCTQNGDWAVQVSTTFPDSDDYIVTHEHHSDTTTIDTTKRSR